MKNVIQQPALQLRTLQIYGEFLCRRKNWAGKLALAAFVGASNTGFAAAASLAGAASLVVDCEADLMKTSFRDGAFDFVVNTLDEALRAIKNEIRLGRPIAIGLMADPVVALTEASERGLAAAVVLCDADGPQQSPYAAVSETNALSMQYEVPSPKLSEWLSQREWSAVEVAHVKSGNAGEKSVGDLLAIDDDIRQKWLRDLSAHQRSIRQGSSRWMWLSPDEETNL